ncbi:hypothetical protein GCM10010520_23130 [Rhizobium viscosum]|uniref:Uncharacterized protein n=1 Tax=Rhizobium viscosum TaxID=1673 RepID=A0ABR9IIT6_RHIVS|nr:hypothetical protein [Rhizobium viscosum]MBE1503086.1 hypothetical protein [Rhizobium viscosum]
MSARLLRLSFLAPIVFVLPGWSLLGGGDPSPDAAQQYLSGRVGNVWNLQLSNCSGDDNRKSCSVAYNRSFGPYKYYEELNMDFQKTPSGWNVLRYSVIKTETL